MNKTKWEWVSNTRYETSDYETLYNFLNLKNYVPGYRAVHLSKFKLGEVKPSETHSGLELEGFGMVGVYKKVE